VNKETKLTKNESQLLLRTPQEIVAHLDQYIVGQDEAKKTLACACYCHLHSCATIESIVEPVWPDNHTLIAGPSGTGKSEMIRVLCSLLKIPNYQIDCTSLTPNGYKGTNISYILNDLEEKFVLDDDITPPCIVIWDEVDKLWDDGSEAGKYRRMTQSDTLKVFEGAKVSERLDLSRILHVACGSFVGMDEILHPKRPPTIGFESALFQDNHSGPVSSTHIEAKHFIEFGLIPELVGRFSRFAATERHDLADMKDIMLKSKISFLWRKIDQYKRHGTKLVFLDDAVEELAKIALNHPSGARGLRQLISHALAPWDFQLSELLTSGILEIRYDRLSIQDGTKAQVVMVPPSAAARKPMPKDGTIQREGSVDDGDIFIF
jgi:ATP-dependent Clp protease ATP-binding subunit ClpX